MPIYHMTPRLAQFLAGQAVRAQEFLGSHPTVRGTDSPAGCSASGLLMLKAVAVMGDFNGWDDRANPMAALEGGVWELFLPGLQQYDNYKYAVHTRSEGPGQGRPLCLPCRDPPGHRLQAVRYWSGYQWATGAGWITGRTTRSTKSPSIFTRYIWVPGGAPARTSSSAIGISADYLVPYVKEMGFTHVELLPVT